jgi:ubiquinone/menaquinone biosynthesis C-methylase UbiE
MQTDKRTGTHDEDRSSRFQAFFLIDEYLNLKNYLYNYRLRKRAVNKLFINENIGRVLEIGSGISPMITSNHATVYSDISLHAMRTMKKSIPSNAFIVADCKNLPFREGVFTHAVASEVLEHIPDDRMVLKELCRVLAKQACLVVTVPHKKSYYAADDDLVGHFRRYEISEINSLLSQESFHVKNITKVLGFLERCIMPPAAIAYSLFLKKKSAGKSSPPRKLPRSVSLACALLFNLINMALMAVLWLENIITPLSLSSVIMIKAEKKDTK